MISGEEEDGKDFMLEMGDMGCGVGDGGLRRGSKDDNQELRWGWIWEWDEGEEIG